MIPLALITGFLGSGKTTLLRRVIEANRSRRLVYLVNEFSMLDVDSRRLAEVGDKLVCLPGGSIFCQCLVTSFINQLQDIAELYDPPDAPLEGLVIEASGIADPRVVSRMLQETGLDGRYRLARIVCMIDPGTFSKLLHTLPNIAAQVATADLAIINKADLFDEAVLDETARAVQAIHPGIPVVRARHAEVDVDLLGTAPRPDVTGDYSPCHDGRYDTQIFTTDHPINIHRMVAQSVGFLDDVYRLKGFVWDGKQLHAIDWSPSSRMTITPVPGPDRRTELTAIFPPLMRVRVESFLAMLGADAP